MSELTKEKKNMRIEEAAETVLKLLKKETHPIYKRVLFRRAEETIQKERRKHGIHQIPTIRSGNRTIEIDAPDFDFIRANWRQISFYCAEQYKKYLVWDRSGIRFGTLQEYRACQGKKAKISSGIAKSHNKCAEIINERGGECQFIEVKRLQIASGE